MIYTKKALRKVSCYMKKIIKSIWILFLLPILVTIVAGITLTKLENINIYEEILTFLRSIYNIVIFILTINIPLWMLLVIGIILFFIFLFIAKLNNSNYKKWYEDYKDDIYKGVRYNWDYSELYNEAIIENFRPVCNKCKGELIKKSSSGNYLYGTKQNYCPNCDKILKTPDDEEIKIAEVYVYNKIGKLQEKNK